MISAENMVLYYDLEKVEEVSINFEIDLNNKETLATIFDEKEELYQTLMATIFSKCKHQGKEKYEAAYTAYAEKILEIFGGEEVMKLSKHRPFHNLFRETYL